MRFLKTEPALIMGAIQAAVTLIVVFGVDLTVKQKAAIISFCAIILSIVTRQMVTPVVTPVAKLKKPSGGSGSAALDQDER